MKKSNPFKGKKFDTFILAGILFISGALALLNWDVFLRAIHSYQNGTLTMEKFRLDLASFDIGRTSPVKPIDTQTSEMDGMIQVYVPESEFVMGSNNDKKSKSFPAHTVYLDAFWMDRVEVTNAMYFMCIKSGGCSDPVTDNIYYDKWAYRNHPMIYVTWFQAQEYCQRAGRRLPTEAEWEKAARGPNGNNYPWGKEAPNPRLANFDRTMIHEAVPSYRYPLGASPYGVLNMAGNVREWVADWFDKDYYSNSPYTNPMGPDTGTTRSLRSGSYNEDQHEIAVFVRYSHEPLSAGLSRGFRCAQSVETGK